MKKYRIKNNSGTPIAINLAEGLKVIEIDEEVVVNVTEEEIEKVKRSAEYIKLDLEITEYEEKSEKEKDKKDKKEKAKPKSRKEKKEEKSEKKEKEEEKSKEK